MSIAGTNGCPTRVSHLNKSRLISSLKTGWQEWRGSNLRPRVLETGALQMELHSCRGPASPPIRAVSSIGCGPMARGEADRAFAKPPVQPGRSAPDLPPSQQEQKGETMTP